MKEKTFNTLFNVLILTGMLVAVVVSNLFKLSQPGVDRALLLVASLGAVMGVVNTVLSANGNILTFLFGVLDVSIYAYVCLHNGVLGQFALHAFYFLPMQFVGFFQWRKRGAKDGAKVRARRLNRRQALLLAAAALAGIAATFTVLLLLDRAKVAAGTLAAVDPVKLGTDAAALVFNILGQVLLSLAFAEQWICWLLVNAFSITIWANALARGADASALVMLLKYSFYFVNALNGLRIWLKLSRSETA